MYNSLNKRLVSFEGIDQCGKSTQARLFLDYLTSQGFEAGLVREPGGTAISEAVRKILLDRKRLELADRTEALLMTASRAQLTREYILPKLETGHWVIADRFTDSTLAYQGAGRHLDLDWLIELNRFATYGVEPCLTFLLDVLPEECQRRQKRKNDRIEGEGLEFQRKVREGYLKIAERFQDRIIILDGYQTIADLHNQVISEVNRRNLI